MLNQRELDIARVEAKMKAKEVTRMWIRDFLNRGGYASNGTNAPTGPNAQPQAPRTQA